MSDQAHPETIYLSACIAAGRWHPLADGFTADDFTEDVDVVEHLNDYARTNRGKAPNIELVKALNPMFGYVPGVQLEWATSFFNAHVINERVRRVLATAAHKVRDGEASEAVTYLAGAQRNLIRGLSTDGMSLREWVQPDPSTIERCPVPAGPLHSVTKGGHEPGQMWLVSARTTIGKSWTLLSHAVAALEGGWKVVLFSLEMTEQDIVDRLHTLAFGVPYNSLGTERRAALHKRWMDSTDADLIIRGPQHGATTPTSLARYADEKTLIVVDYIGLMLTDAGERAVSDWRAMAAISNDVKTVALAEGVPIIAGVQANRQAASKQAGSSHGLESLSQSDALAHDCDVHIGIDPYGARVRLNTLGKNRNGQAGVRWYTAFDPGAADFAPLTPDQAQQRLVSDEESDPFWLPGKEDA